MSNFNTTGQQTPGLDEPIEPPLSGSEHKIAVPEQHGIQLDPFARIYIIAQSLYLFLRSRTLPGHQTDQRHDGISIHPDSWFCILFRDLINFLKHDAFTAQPSFTGGCYRNSASWSIPVTDLYHFLQCCALPGSESPPSGNGDEMPVDSLLLLISEESLFEFLQLYQIPEPSSPPAVQQFGDDSGSDPTSQSVRSTPSQDSHDQIDAQPNEATASILHGCSICPVCQCTFYRVQERNRHVESYLPHSILCPLHDCTWTGRRQGDFKGHWRRKHSEDGQAPGEDANRIYDPKDFVQSIADGTPVEKVARSAFAKAQVGLGRLGRPDVGAAVLGRNRDLKEWIRIPLSQLD